MSFVDFSAQPIFTVQAYKAIAADFADSLRNAFKPTTATHSVTASASKLARLPAIDAVQTSIFRELRVREEGIARDKAAQAARPLRATLFGRTHASFNDITALVH